MSIALVVTRGFGSGTLAGTVKDVVLAGYAIGVPPPVVPSVRVNSRETILIPKEDRTIIIPREDRDIIL